MVRLLGRVISYRRSRHNQYEKQFVVYPEGVKDKNAAAKLVGKKVVWKSPAGKRIVGKVAASHGNKGGVRIIVERGLPGQALGTTIEIAE